MALVIAADPVPLETDAEGVARVGGTRVTLDTIVDAFLDGETAEEIAQQYPSVRLADVYAVIAFYLRRRAEVDRYLHERQRRARTVRAESESRFDPAGLRGRLLVRHAETGA
jgi:uncharacterized protein (DUF433 family)